MNLYFVNISNAFNIYYPEFNILKYVCYDLYKHRLIKHIDLDDVILYPELFTWFCSYFKFNKNKINMEFTVKLGLLNCMKHLHNNGYTFDHNYICSIAIKYNNYDCFLYAHKNKDP